MLICRLDPSARSEKRFTLDLVRRLSAWPRNIISAPYGTSFSRSGCSRERKNQTSKDFPIVLRSWDGGFAACRSSCLWVTSARHPSDGFSDNASTEDNPSCLTIITGYQSSASVIPCYRCAITTCQGTLDGRYCRCASRTTRRGGNENLTTDPFPPLDTAAADMLPWLTTTPTIACKTLPRPSRTSKDKRSV